MTFHICCRDCRFEGLEGDGDEADRIRETHESDTGHNVVSDRVDGSARMVTDGGRDTLRLTDDGIEIPEDVDFSEGIVFRARGATVDHKPGHSDREFYPMFEERHLTAEDRSVVNEDLDEFEISIKPYGEEPRTYEVTVPATDGGLVEHPGLEAVAADEYDGAQQCDYGCGSVADYLVELRLEGSATTSLVCDDCSQQHRLWVRENDVLEDTAEVDPLAQIAGETEVEVTCSIAQDAPDACDGWTGTVELDGPARCVNGRLKLPGFDWECPECGNPSEFEVDGTRVSAHV